MNTIVKRELETRAHAGRRIDGQLCPCDARPLLDDRRADAALLQLARGQAPLEFEPLTVVFDDQAAGMFGVGEAHEHVARATVLPHVDERLLDDARELE